MNVTTGNEAEAMLDAKFFPKHSGIRLNKEHLEAGIKMKD